MGGQGGSHERGPRGCGRGSGGCYARGQGLRARGQGPGTHCAEEQAHKLAKSRGIVVVGGGGVAECLEDDV